MKTPNPEFVRQLKTMVKNSPYPSHMRMALTEISFDACTVEMALARCHLQPYGIVHGGVLATLIDTATFWAAFLRLPQEDGLVNVDLKLNYLKPVVNGMLTAEGRCLRPGRTISYAEARVVDEEGALVAHGTSSLMALPGKGMDMAVPKFL
ncbi:MAG: PaaI family thioesterase [Desulfobacter sp.]|nr:MAG: PaaI family thioesterase [Desulfobacter sp.]